MVKKVQPHISQKWVNKSNQLLEKLLDDYQPNIIDQVHLHLIDLDKASQAGMVTESMQTIIQIAKDGGGVAKMSGAGGGDCVLVFIPKSKKAWFTKQMKSLNFVLLSDII